VRNNNNRQSLYLIDKAGRRVIKKKDCRWRHSFREGLALIYSENNQNVIINEQCEEVFRLSPDLKTDAIYYTAKGYDGKGAYGNSSYFSEGLLLVSREVAGEKLFGYLDRTGKTVIDFKFS